MKLSFRKNFFMPISPSNLRPFVLDFASDGTMICITLPKCGRAQRRWPLIYLKPFFKCPRDSAVLTLIRLRNLGRRTWSRFES